MENLVRQFLKTETLYRIETKLPNRNIDRNRAKHDEQKHDMGARQVKKELRYYQKDCIRSIVSSLKAGHVPYANCVTGFGKSVVAAHLTGMAVKQGKRVLQLVPNHKLCDQNHKQTEGYLGRKIGMCSAKAKRYELLEDVVIATQTTFVRHRNKGGGFDLLIVDEADLVSPDPDTMYQKIIKTLRRHNPDMKIVGMTGSPYRQDQGMLHDPVKDGNVIFTECCYESDIPRLIQEGYLSHVEVVNTHVQVNLEGVRTVRGDYDQDEAGLRFDEIVEQGVADMKAIFEANNINTALVFASTISNAERIVAEYGSDECRIAHGELDEKKRDELLHWFERGKGRRVLVNVGLYCRGYDYTALQALVLFRATQSLRLYVQIIGRLLRSHEDKPFGYLLDYGTNVERFGPIDNLDPPKPPKKGEAPEKACTECWELNPLSVKFCKACGAEFVSFNDGTGLYAMRTVAEILAAKKEAKTVKIDNPMIIYGMAWSRKDHTPMIKMAIHDKYRLVHEHYICIEHAGAAGGHAVRFLLRLFKDAKDFYELSANGELNAENLTLLLSHNYDDYFRKVTYIAIAPGEDKYKVISEMVVE